MQKLLNRLYNKERIKSSHGASNNDKGSLVQGYRLSKVLENIFTSKCTSNIIILLH